MPDEWWSVQSGRMAFSQRMQRNYYSNSLAPFVCGCECSFLAALQQRNFYAVSEPVSTQLQCVFSGSDFNLLEDEKCMGTQMGRRRVHSIGHQ